MPSKEQTLLTRYQTALKKGDLKPDAAQMAAVTYLTNVEKALNNKCAQSLKSVYIHGPVGRGKSMIMGMFCQGLHIMYRRVHFHAFMEELHARLHAMQGEKGDPVTRLAKQLGGEARVLCFDEFYITNIADAMLLGRLFEKLFQENVLIVSTSNWAVTDLFQGGVNRQQFMPFIRLMEKHMDMIELAGGVDHRMGDITQMPFYIYLDHYGNADKQLETYFRQFRKIGAPAPTLPTAIPPKRAAAGVAWYSFNFLCGQHVGREEYLALATAIDTLIVESVPLFSSAEVDAALRFVTLVDILYENKVRLIVSAAEAPHALCPEGEASAPFTRCASRIMEMQRW